MATQKMENQAATAQFSTSGILFTLWRFVLQNKLMLCAGALC